MARKKRILKKRNIERYVPRKDKYIGNTRNVVGRSSWETKSFAYLDAHPNVVKWSSEEIAIKYLSPIDKRTHRYFPDLYIEMKNGDKYLIEIKPKRSQSPPKDSGKKSKRTLIYETCEYVKNQSKWEAAQEFAEQNGLIFEIWNEDTLKAKKII